MRSGKHYKLSSSEVHGWAISWVLDSKLLADHGWKCTACVVLNIVFLAATRSISIFAACRDLANAPTDRALMDALHDGLPKTLKSLERKLNEPLCDNLPRRMLRRSWHVAIDMHLVPYYGQPYQSKNELYYGKPRQGTKKFHAYATACIVSHGQRYTLALTYVRRHETDVVVLTRLLERIRKIGVKIKSLLLDRAYFPVAVVEFLKAEKLRFLMPVMIRGRRPKRGKKAKGLRWIRQQNAGWYTHTMKNKKQEVKVNVCVGYRYHKNRKDGKRKRRKLLFAGWRIKGTPTEIRALYRKRFGIETSYRQMRQARIYTCTRDPRSRLFFVAMSLILRNLWVWIHALHLSNGPQEHLRLHLERLRFKRMLNWIAHEVVALLHDGSALCVEWDL